MHDKAAIPQAGSRRPVCVHLFNLIVIKGGVSIIILVIIIVIIIVTRPSHTDHFKAMFVVRIKVTNNHGDPKDPVIAIVVITRSSSWLSKVLQISILAFIVMVLVNIIVKGMVYIMFVKSLTYLDFVACYHGPYYLVAQLDDLCHLYWVLCIDDLYFTLQVIEKYSAAM